MKFRILGLLLIVLVLSSFIQDAYALTTGQLSPTTAISTGSTINQFAGRNNAFTSNNNYARGANNDDQAYGGFGISIPTYATINGITVNLEGQRFQCASADNPRFRVQLSTPSLIGNPTGLGSFTSTTQTTTNYGSSDSTITLGGVSDMWGLSYTSTQLTNFWVLVTALCNTGGNNLRLDHLTVEITYTLTVPNAPVLSTTGHTSSTISLSWTTPTNGGSAITSYTLERSINNFVSVDQSFSIPFGTNTKVDSGLSPNTSYQYRVKATNVIGDSPYSNILPVTTDSTIPDTPILSEISHTSLSVATSWTTPFNGGTPITSYTLERSTDNFGSIDQSYVLLFGTNTYNNTGLSANTLYQFRVKATNPVGDSPYSNIVSVTTDPTPPPIDVTPPVLTILGFNPLNHTINTPYIDAGATANDDFDGDITTSIITTNNVNASALGTYTVDYFVEDLAGNNSTASRTVYVVSSPPISPPISNSTTPTPHSNQCRDCVPPTLGIDVNNKARVSGGFTYNGKTVDVTSFRTPFPQIGTNVGDNNTLTLKIYEDSGVNNIKHIAIGFGLEKNRGFSESKAYIEFNRDWKGNTSTKITGNIQNVTYSSNIVQCGIVRANCLEFTVYHTFTKDVSGIVGTLVWDDKRNSWSNYFNHGIIIKDNKIIIQEPEPEKVDEDKLKGVTSFGYFERKSFAFENYKQYQADEAKKLFNSLYGRINNWD